jgi:hypothetical protein
LGARTVVYALLEGEDVLEIEDGILSLTDPDLAEVFQWVVCLCNIEMEG